MSQNTVEPHQPSCPEVLFHYTSIETLALILSSKKIRFNRLDRVNDLDEAQSPDFSSAQTLVFASCWTATELDEIALWKLYTDLTGVRIALPTNMFAGKKQPQRICDFPVIVPEDRDVPFVISLEDEEISGGLLPIVVDRRGTLPNATRRFLSWQVYGPTPIRYFDDYNSLKTNCLSSDGKFAAHSIMSLGSKKHANWRFENEFRFRIFAWFPKGSEQDSFTFLSPQELLENPVATMFVDVPLDAEAVNEAAIMLAPRTTHAHKIVVESLCMRYAPGITDIQKSSIRIR